MCGRQRREAGGVGKVQHTQEFHSWRRRVTLSQKLQTRQEPLQQSWWLMMSGPRLWAEQTLSVGILSVLWNRHPSILRFSGQRLKTEDAPKIHVSLSVSLFLLNLTFFINMGHGAPDSSTACRARGAIFHYYLLCTFTWMSLEAFHLYLLVIKVFNTYISHYFLKLSLVGWGLPALVVIGTASANSYGRYFINDKDMRVTLELCWFYKKTALYTTVHGYFIITFLCNAVILGLVAWKIFTLPSATAGKEKSQNWKAVLTMLGLSTLLGMTWGLAVLTPLGLSIIYIFALLNSLQGVFIFCWFLVLYFPLQRSTASSSGTARVDQAQFTSHE